MGAIVVTSTRLDHHDVLGEGLAIVTAEADLDSSGLLRSTASAVNA